MHYTTDEDGGGESDANRCTCSNNQSKCRSTIFFNIEKYQEITVENLHTPTLIMFPTFFIRPSPSILDQVAISKGIAKYKLNGRTGKKLKRFAFKHIQTIFILHFSSFFAAASFDCNK